MEETEEKESQLQVCAGQGCSCGSTFPQKPKDDVKEDTGQVWQMELKTRNWIDIYQGESYSRYPALSSRLAAFTFKEKKFLP